MCLWNNSLPVPAFFLSLVACLVADWIIRQDCAWDTQPTQTVLKHAGNTRGDLASLSTFKKGGQCILTAVTRQAKVHILTF